MLTVGYNSRFKIIRYKEPCHTAEELYHVDVGINPGFFFHVWERFSKTIHAEWQGTNKYVGLGYCAGYRVVKL